jgi:hypothetical protein
MEALTNFELEKMAKQLHLPLVGVFSKDKVPGLQVGSYYINMQDADEGEGTHWVLLKIFDNKHALYFDSFGMPPPKDIIEKAKTSIPYSNRHIQDIGSQACGYYVLACDKYMSSVRRKSMRDQFDDFLNMFVGDTKLNDRILKDYLRL